MATRSRQTWKLDAQGQYARQIGWKQNPKASESSTNSAWGPICRKPPREQRLRELWERSRPLQNAERPLG